MLGCGLTSQFHLYRELFSRPAWRQCVVEAIAQCHIVFEAVFMQDGEILRLVFLTKYFAFLQGRSILGFHT